MSYRSEPRSTWLSLSPLSLERGLRRTDKRDGLATLVTFYRGLTFWSGKERLMPVYTGTPPPINPRSSSPKPSERQFFISFMSAEKQIACEVWAPISIPHYASLPAFSLLEGVYRRGLVGLKLTGFKRAFLTLHPAAILHHLSLT